MEISEKTLCHIARMAGEIIMEVYNSSEDIEVEKKEDNSPVTIADKKADKEICIELKKYYPDIPILSEESEHTDYSIRKNWPRCFIVDPLDGTKEFIKRNGEFTVNIAYVENGKSVSGVVYAPVIDVMYYTENGKSYRSERGEKGVLLPQEHKRDKTIVVVSRSHINDTTSEWISRLGEHELLRIGSSLKICKIAEGSADIYPRFAPTSEWDTAAAHAIVNNAGGELVDAQSREELRYNKENILNPHFLVQRKN